MVPPDSLPPRSQSQGISGNGPHPRHGARRLGKPIVSSSGRWFRSFVLLVAFGLSTGISGTTPCSTSCSAQTQSLASPGPELRSLRALRQWGATPGSPDASFEFAAYLVQTAPTWPVVRVEDRGHAAGLKVTPEMAIQLHEIPVGTMLTFRGRAFQDQNSIPQVQLEDFANNLVRFRLRPAKAKLGLGQNGTPLARYGTAVGEIREILKFTRRTFIVVEQDGFTFDVVHHGKNKRLRPEHIGQKWGFSGCVNLTDRESATRSIHEIALMNEDQMLRHRYKPRPNASSKAASAPLKTSSPSKADTAPNAVKPNVTQTDTIETEEPAPMKPFEGVVVYCDYNRHIAIVKNNQRFWLRSKLAHCIKPGDQIRGIAVPVWRQGSDVTTFHAKYTIKLHSNDIPIPAPIAINNVSSLFFRNRLPPRICLTGTVERCVFHQHTMNIVLRTDTGRVFAQVPNHQTESMPSFGSLAPGTAVELTGMPDRSEFSATQLGTDPTTFVRISLASANDIRVLDSPLTLSSVQAFEVGGIVLVGLIGTLFWIVRLRRRVIAQDRSLTEFDHQFQSAFGAMQCGVLIVDAESRIVRSNHRLSPFFGINPTLDSPLTHYFPTIEHTIDDATGLSKLLDQSARRPDEAFSSEFLMDDLLRTTRIFTCPIELDGASGYSRLWLFEDVSEKRQLESDLVHSQKMEAVGRLSGGIAHDFNNLLMVIQSSLQMIREDSSQNTASGPGRNVSQDTVRPQDPTAVPDDPHFFSLGHAEPDALGPTALRSAELAVQRATELTQQLLGFARRQRLEKRTINAVELINDIETLASRVIHPTQTLSIERQCEHVSVNVDRGRIEQALLNLCINAIDATQKDGGAISLSISKVDDSALGDCVRFSIVDNGEGIERDDRKNIFDPFFTTKPNGQGTGLGLSVALGIVEQHGGRIECDSSPQRGSRFDIFLPAASDVVNLPEPNCESLSVLVVEDEPGVRDATCSLLRMLGHRVESFENAMLAMTHLSGTTPDVDFPDLVLLDIVLPEMSGLEAFQEIRSVWPDLPILFCSGNVDAASLIANSCGPHAPGLLPKPFTADQMKTALAAIDRPEMSVTLGHSIKREPAWSEVRKEDLPIGTD